MNGSPFIRFFGMRVGAAGVSSAAGLPPAIAAVTPF